MKLRVAVPESLKRLAESSAAGPVGAAAGGSLGRQLGNRGPQLATVVLAAAIAAQLALLAWKFLPGQAAVPPPLAGGPAQPAFDPAAILNAHLFGTAAPAANASA